MPVRYPLYGVDIVILYLVGLRVYLWQDSGELGNQFLSMNLTGLKYVSQGAVQAVVVSNVDEYNLCGTAV